MSSAADPTRDAQSAPHDATQQALVRLSAVIWRCVLRLDQHEQRAKAQQAAPPDPSTPEQQPADHGAPGDER
jgi:hypothetical protein